MTYMSKEIRERLRIASKEWWSKPENYKRQVGWHHSEETKLKQSNKKKGKKFLSKEHYENLSKSFTGKGNPFFNKTHQPEIKLIMSLKKRGTNHPNYGKPLPELTKKKIGDKRRGHRHTPETKARLRAITSSKLGPEAPRWQGGKSFEPYCQKFNREFKERVRAWFNYHCVECGEPENGTKLSVHHVNFKKNSCCDPDAPKLFVPLCVSCHTKTQSRREYWEQHFTDMIDNYYGGKCYFTFEEMQKI